jgi:hypothetical protein
MDGGGGGRRVGFREKKSKGIGKWDAEGAGLRDARGGERKADARGRTHGRPAKRRTKFLS